MMATHVQHVSNWRSAHEDLTRLARARAGLDFEEGQKLRAAQRARVHERLGHGSFVEYIERLFGYAPRLTLEKLRVAEALERLPLLAGALREAQASWSSLRELTRVATPETEQDWLTASRGRTMREVERLVAGHRPGDLPGTPKDLRAEQHILRFEVSGDVLATFREALARLRRDAGGPLDDDAALLLMARRVLGGPTDDGRASYQVVIGICEACERATQTGAGEPVEVSPNVGAMASCDAQRLGRVSGETHVGIRPRAERASQTIPPSVRRAVLLRDKHRCQVPGCRHATFVDVHHLRARADGGQHEACNLLTLCNAHHRACHSGSLLIELQASGALRFCHADGTAYGALTFASAALDTTRAFQALRKLGFGERDVRAALQEARAHVGSESPEERGRAESNVEPLIRSALNSLTRNAWQRAS